MVAEHEPELGIVAVRMPPTYEDEGMMAAIEIRRTHPRTAVLVLSQHVESRHAVDLVGSGGGFGYLLKDRVLDVDEFLEAVQRVSHGSSALDPEVVRQLFAPPQDDDALAQLTPREREVLGLMAEGRTNAGIAKHLWLTEKTVETHVSSILGKLGLSHSAEGHRRVLAVLTYLRASAAEASFGDTHLVDGYTIFHADELDWQPRREGDARLAAGLSDGLTRSRANLFRYPPGAVGRRHIDPIQEEVFVVLEGTLTIHMGEGDEPERHELAPGSVLVVQPGTALQLSNRGDGELRLFIYGAPPERGEATFLPPVG